MKENMNNLRISEDSKEESNPEEEEEEKKYVSEPEDERTPMTPDMTKT